MPRKGWRPRRRVFPINYVADRINVQRGPNKDVLSILQRTVRSTRGRKDQREPVENNTFMRPIPPTRSRKEDNWFDEEGGIFKKAEPTPLEDARHRQAKLERTVKTYLKSGKEWLLTGDRSRLVRLWQSENGSKWGVETMYHFKIYNDPKMGSLKLFFAGTEFRFVEEIGGKGFLSTAYRSKEQAMHHLMQGKIRWLYDIHFLPA